MLIIESHAPKKQIPIINVFQGRFIICYKKPYWLESKIVPAMGHSAKQFHNYLEAKNFMNHLIHTNKKANLRHWIEEIKMY